MALKRIVIKQSRANQSILEIIVELLEVNEGTAKLFLRDGKVFENGRKLKASEYFRNTFQELTVYMDTEALKNSTQTNYLRLQEKNVISSTPKILYQDKWLVVVDKPWGLSTQPTIDKNRPNLFDWLKTHLGGYVGLHHRLDRDTSGVILFTTAKESNASIARQFLERSIQKTYLAICEKTSKKLKSPLVVKNYLKKEKISSKMSKMIVTQSGGDYAETHFNFNVYPSCTHVLAEPKTGRMHQIRAHLSEIGMPILGDTLYGSKLNLNRFYLHAWKLRLRHPITDEPLEVISALPSEFQKESKKESKKE